LYVIEKAFKSYSTTASTSTVFEYAMCLSCLEEMNGKMSVESRAKIDAYYEEHINFDERREKLIDTLNEKDWLKECIIDKQEPSKGGEFQIYGQCNGETMFFQDFPFMIRGEAIDKMVSLLSNETLDELNGFMDNITSGPPEFRALLETTGVKIFI